MQNLVKLELKRVSLKSHFISLLAANVVQNEQFRLSQKSPRKGKPLFHAQRKFAYGFIVSL